MNKETTKSRIVKAIIYIFLVFMAILYLAPLLWVFLVSLKTNK